MRIYRIILIDGLFGQCELLAETNNQAEAYKLRSEYAIKCSNQPGEVYIHEYECEVPNELYKPMKYAL